MNRWVWPRWQGLGYTMWSGMRVCIVGVSSLSLSHFPTIRLTKKQTGVFERLGCIVGGSCRVFQRLHVCLSMFVGYGG